jgi:hypothetical protein
VLDVIGKTALEVPVIIPSQLSVAVGAFNVVSEQELEISVKLITSGTGEILSFITTFCV